MVSYWLYNLYYTSASAGSQGDSAHMGLAPRVVALWCRGESKTDSALLSVKPGVRFQCRARAKAPAADSAPSAAAPPAPAIPPTTAPATAPPEMVCVFSTSVAFCCGEEVVRTWVCANNLEVRTQVVVVLESFGSQTSKHSPLAAHTPHNPHLAKASNPSGCLASQNPAALHSLHSPQTVAFCEAMHSPTEHTPHSWHE
jgi:hypothetical protein